jgi:hypothetical protein
MRKKTKKKKKSKKKKDKKDKPKTKEKNFFWVLENLNGMFVDKQVQLTFF